ncbi:hypothetical protein OCUAc18_28730 [Acinetobacter baumannii]|nr:hypothetical protein OCUAc18_28730 [Acinetobacter baumannii]
MKSVIESDDTHYKVKIEMFETHHNYLSAIMLNQAQQAKKKGLDINFDGSFLQCLLLYLTLNLYVTYMDLN